MPSQNFSCPSLFQASHTELVVGKEFACQCRRRKRRSSIPGLGNSLEKGMETHSSIFTWRIPWTERVWQATVHGLQRIWHKWSNLACTPCLLPISDKGKKSERDTSITILKSHFPRDPWERVKWKTYSFIDLQTHFGQLCPWNALSSIIYYLQIS